MRAFFDSLLLENEGEAFIREEKVDIALRRLVPGAHLTKGDCSYVAYAEQRDLVWNHMDQAHRPLLHRTYGEAMRVAIGKRSAFSMTRFGGLPIVIPVFDGYFRENAFYQVLCILGLFVIVNVIECQETDQGTRMRISWTIASHRFLRFMHPMFNRRLRRLNDIQNPEDDVIRHRRVELRAAGYRFGSDEPDFFNSNVISNNVVFPPLTAARDFDISDIGQQQTKRIDLGDRAYIVRRKSDALEVWPGVCLHEGASLTEGDVCGGSVKCPWHGLEFAARTLSPDGSAISMCGARLKLSDGKLHVSPAART
jgi:nitrite reductase/ring-hydroxylating ferredoxin subunit